MKTRALVRRTARTEVTPTRIEMEELTRRQAEEVQAEDKLDFHARQERAHAKYLTQFKYAIMVGVNSFQFSLSPRRASDHFSYISGVRIELYLSA
jgi:hypothetical protein